MNFQKAILIVFLGGCFSFWSNNLTAQAPQKIEVEQEKDVEKREDTMVLQKRKRVLSKADKEQQIQQIKKRKAARKKDKLYLSPSRVERAKMDLERKKRQKKISQKEILKEEQKIKRSEAQLKRKTKEVKKISKKINQ